MRIAAIVNPVSGRKTAGKEWPLLLDSLGRAAAGVETFWTERPGHAELLAAEARRSGYDRVIAVGGDGTLFEILNGLWWEKRGDLPSVGMVPMGTACDYIRNFEVDRSLIGRLRAAVSPFTTRVSLGRCRVQNEEGERERVFAMILGLGLDAQVVRLFKTGRFGRSGWTAYALSALKIFIGRNSLTLSGNIDGFSFHTNGMFFGAALSCYFGKRIEIAPGASPVRNRFELVWAEPVGFFGKLLVIFLAYFGAHRRLSWMKTARASRICLDTVPGTWVQADGEEIGRTPVVIEIIPEAFSFAGGRASRPGLTPSESPLELPPQRPHFPFARRKRGFR